MLMCVKLLGCLVAFSAVFASAAAEAQSASLALQRGGRHGSTSLQSGYGAAISACPPGLVTRAPRPTWVPGHGEQVPRRAWVCGGFQRHWVPPVYQTRYGPGGWPVRVLISPGHWAMLQEPGHYEDRCETVWVPGRWAWLRS